MKKIYVMGGGTFSHVRTHLSLAVPAFGTAAKTIAQKLQTAISEDTTGFYDDYEVIPVFTAMAGGSLITNEDVEKFLKALIADPDTRGIVFNVAMCDYTGQIGFVDSSKHATRLRTDEGPTTIKITPSEKVIGLIRKTRKDIFAVGFKTTSGAERGDQYVRGLRLLKKNSLNLVLANDVGNRNNMVIAPEETQYGETTNRDDALQTLVDIMMARMRNTFTRSTVTPGEAVGWNSEAVPESLRTVVNHCIGAGAYKPFLGSTAGHFAVKVSEGKFLTSIRKTNYNNLESLGLVRIDSVGDDRVVAHGHRPSVGGQSQRIIFREHDGLDCIVHFHCPPKEGVMLPTVSQFPNECGSHQCGQATSGGLTEVDLGDGDKIKVVYLDAHGPNIVFNRNTNPQKIIQYIGQTFDLSQKTGGMVA